jgi:hypothetical protein
VPDTTNSHRPSRPSLLDTEYVLQLLSLAHVVYSRHDPITVSRLRECLCDPADPDERAALDQAVDSLVEGELVNRQHHRNKDDAHLAPTMATLSFLRLWGCQLD